MNKPRRKPVAAAGRRVKCAQCGKPHVSDGLHRECVNCRPAPEGQQADCHRCRKPHISNGVNVNCQVCRDYLAACKRLNRGGQQVVRSRVSIALNPPPRAAESPPVNRALRELLGAAAAPRSMQPPAARSSPLPQSIIRERETKSLAADGVADMEATIPLPERLPPAAPPDDPPAEVVADGHDDRSAHGADDAPVDGAADEAVDIAADTPVDAPTDPAMTAQPARGWPVVVWQPMRPDPAAERRKAAEAFLAAALAARPADAAHKPTKEARRFLRQLEARRRPQVTLSDTLEAAIGRPLPASVKRDLDTRHPSQFERWFAYRWRSAAGTVTYAGVQLSERLASIRRAVRGIPRAINNFIDDGETV